MPRYRIVFMGSPDFAIPALQKLAEIHDICAVYTQPAKPAGRGMKSTPVPVAAYAADKSLALFSPASLKTNDAQEQLAGHEADLFVVVAYGLLLPKIVLNMPKLGCINGHASLLPRWRGAAPIQRAIAAGDAVTGISAMLMDEGLDTGKVLMRRSCKIDPAETAGSLHDKLAKLNAETLDEVVADITSLLTTAEPQDDRQAFMLQNSRKRRKLIGPVILPRLIVIFERLRLSGAWCLGQRAVFAFYRPARQI